MTARDVPAAPPASPAPTHAAPDRPRRGVRLPGWLAAVVVAVAVAGAAYVGWRLLRPAPAVDLSQFESNDTGRGFRAGRGNRGPAEAAEGVTLQPDGGGTVRAGAFVVQFLPGVKPSLIPRSPVRPEPADAKVLAARRSILNNVPSSKKLGVTAAQIAKLRQITTTIPPAVDPPTRATLLDLWARLRQATPDGKPAAEQILHDAVTAAAAKHTAAVTSSGKAAADQVRAAVPADVLKKF